MTTTNELASVTPGQRGHEQRRRVAVRVGLETPRDGQAEVRKKLPKFLNMKARKNGLKIKQKLSEKLRSQEDKNLLAFAIVNMVPNDSHFGRPNYRFNKDERKDYKDMSARDATEMVENDLKMLQRKSLQLEKRHKLEGREAIQLRIVNASRVKKGLKYCQGSQNHKKKKEMMVIFMFRKLL